MHERRIARAEDNQIEMSVGDQLALVNNPDSQAYRFGKDGNDIYSQVDFIVCQRNGTVELFAELVIQVAYFNAISFGRIFVAVVIADVSELVAWLDVENIWQTFRKVGKRLLRDLMW